MQPENNNPQTTPRPEATLQQIDSSPPEPTTPPVQPLTSQSQPEANSNPPIYRQYWPFGIVFILAPFGVIFGITILLTGDIFKNVNGSFKAISKKEKTTLLIAGVILQLLGIFSIATK